MPIIRTLAIWLLAPTLAAAQAGGFVPGQVWIHSWNVNSTYGDGAALVRLDPDLLTGALVIEYAKPPLDIGVNSICYEPFRNALFLRGTFQGTTGQNFVDPAGQPTFAPMVLPGQATQFAPTGDGRVYMNVLASSGGSFWWMDAHGSVRVLLNDAGTAPFEFDPGPTVVDAMLYHPASKALVTASRLTEYDCGGAQFGTGVVLKKVHLSADGSRSSGNVTCNWVPVSPPGIFEFDVPSQLTPAPDGTMLLSVITKNNDAVARLVRVDPNGLGFTTWAVNGPYSACGIGTACYSEHLDRAVLHDVFNDVLRLFAEGESGDGTIVVPSVPVSAPCCNSVKEATILEIPVDECTGGFGVFGLGHSGTSAAAPFLSGLGCPAPGTSVTLRVSGAPASAAGLVFFGLSQAELPFKGGTLFVSPILLTIPLTTSATGSAALAALVPNDPSLPGTVAFLQAGLQNSAAAQGVALTQGLEVRIP